ncbi:MAG: hypothetical protein IKJ36_04555 [Clostridia bacterium]|nr:hypothetical protein [Clostridia bacterium]
MTKVMKVVVVAILAALLMASLVSVVNAESISFGDINETTVTKDAKDTTGAASSLNRIIGSAITIVQVVGVGVAIIMLIVLAIKYISAAPGDKADIKKHAVVYVVGAVVLFAASGILGIVKNFAKNVTAD